MKIWTVMAHKDGRVEIRTVVNLPDARTVR